MDRERAIAEIAANARAERPKTAPVVKVAALVAVALGVIACIVVWVVEDEPRRVAPTSSEPVTGFSSGLVVGIAIGIAIGFAIARQLKRD